MTAIAPVLFGALFVTPIETEFLNHCPKVGTSFIFFIRTVNLLDRGVDVAVPINGLPDSSMQAIWVGQLRCVIFASPGYFASQDIPTVPDHLHGHTIISVSSLIRLLTGANIHSLNVSEF